MEASNGFNSQHGMITVCSEHCLHQHAINLLLYQTIGEGTIFEPTREFGNQFLNILQSKQGLQYGDVELELVKKLYAKRVQYKDDLTQKAALDYASQCLIDLEPEKAAQVLDTL